MADKLAKSKASPDWTFLSNHAHVLICLWQDNKILLRTVSEKVGITERAVQRIVADLVGSGYLRRGRQGRCNTYKVAENRFLRHPLEARSPVTLLFEIASYNSLSPRATDSSASSRTSRAKGVRGVSIEAPPRVSKKSQQVSSKPSLGKISTGEM